MPKRTLDLTEGQWALLKEMLYDDTQMDHFNGAASRAIYEEIDNARVRKGSK